ncbi:hypothetical protein V501_02076 [Pseudogymnoascus sp. VKM F-4519 (FW-2642)]|nr:hypothetical protein V501_02076 [Pseudogymnoascus sp. VKM F-4519 (FW-2642)]
MALPFLPTELLHHIARHATSLQTLRTLACLNRRFYAVFGPLLYQQDAQCPPSAAINWAAKHGAMDLLEKSLGHGAEVSLYAPGYKPCVGQYSPYVNASKPQHPLCLAVQNGHVDIAELLIARGCGVNMQVPAYFSLLCLAVKHGQIHMSRSLLGLGARQEINTRFNLNSPIEIAALRGDKAMIELLLHYGSRSTYPTNTHLQGALQYAIAEGHRHVLKPLLNSNIDLNFHFTGRSLRRFVYPLLWAVEEEDVELVKMFVASGANPNVHTIGGESALERAIVRHNEEMVRILISGTDRKRRTHALARSMAYPDGRIAQILLDNGTVADFQEGDSAESERYGDERNFGDNATLIPPLISAVILGHSDLVRLLVARGANVNVEYHGRVKALPDPFVGEALLLAVKLENEEIANVLRDHGADGIVEGSWTKFGNWSYYKI